MAKGYIKKYPNGTFHLNGNHILEETGELTKEINHFENTGIKIQEYGQLSKIAIVKEMHEVI